MRAQSGVAAPSGAATWGRESAPRLRRVVHQRRLEARERGLRLREEPQIVDPRARGAGERLLVRGDRLCGEDADAPAQLGPVRDACSSSSPGGSGASRS